MGADYAELSVRPGEVPQNGQKLRLEFVYETGAIYFFGAVEAAA